MRGKPLLVALTLIALVKPQVTLSADGVLEINQACAVNSGCFPGDAPGFPVTIGEPGSYRLTSNLTTAGEANPESVTAIEISNPYFVTLDLGGFEISGPTDCPTADSCAPLGSGTGVECIGLEGNGISIRDGSIRGMPNFAVQCWASTQILRLHAVGNGGGGVSVFGQVLESTVEGNAGTGVAAYEGSVESCRVVENDGRGVYGNHTLITDNVILWNGDFAITGENNGYGRNVLLTEVGHLGSGNHVEIAPNLCLNSSGGTIDCTVCPNGACELPESNSSCPADCPPVCGDGFCYAASETCTCPSDCGSPCGDGLCNCGETVGTCSIDCR